MDEQERWKRCLRKVGKGKVKRAGKGKEKEGIWKRKGRKIVQS